MCMLVIVAPPIVMGAWSNGISAKTACWVLFFGIIEEFVVRDILLVDSYYVDILSQSL